MKLYFKKYFFILLLAVLSLGTLVSFGYADFYFGDTNTSTEISDVPTRADPIRQNAVFGEQGDTGTTGTKYYDVYFMAQSVQGGVSLAENRYYYQNIETTMNAQNAHFGAFYDGTGNLLADDINEDNNRYFKKIENVAEISLLQLDEIGEPRTLNIYDHASSSTSAYDISFLCYTPFAEPVYALNNVSNWPTSNQLQSGNFRLDNNSESTETTTGYKVEGYYPSTYSMSDSTKQFTSFYANSLLEIYDEFSVTIEGKNCLFFYPVYTIGKNYINLSTDNIKDEMSFYRVDSKDEKELLGYAAYEGELTSEVQQAVGNNFNVYSITNYVFDAEEYQNYTYYLSSDPTSYLTPDWVYPRVSPTSGMSMNNNQYEHIYYNSNLDSSSDNYNVFSDHLLNLGISSGRYNIYIIVKSNNDDSSINLGGWRPDYDNYGELRDAKEINAGELDKINYALANSEDYNVNIYDVRLSDLVCGRIQEGWLGSNYFSRQYYIVYERLFEPRLLGGTTGTYSYRNSDSIFTRVGMGDQKDDYILRDVYLDPTTSTEFEYNGVQNVIENNKFAVQLLPEDGMTYRLQTDDDTNIGTGWPTIIVGYEGETPNEEYYLSDSLIKAPEYNDDGSTNGTRLYQTNDDSEIYNNSGTYNLYIKVSYDSFSFGDTNNRYDFSNNVQSKPASITLYAYQFNDLFINIYDSENDIVYQDASGINPNYLDGDEGYSRRIWNLSQGTRLSSTMDFLNDSGAGTQGTLGQYIQELDNNNQCLMEYVSGRYITLENYQAFVVDKNYIFVVCDKPSA